MNAARHIGRSWMRICALALLAALSLGARAGAQEDVGDAEPRLTAARETYEPASWPVSGRRAGYALGAFELEGFVGGPVEVSGGLVTRRFRAAEPGASGFQAELLVADDAAGAKEQMLHWLAGVSSPGQVPRAAELGIAAGDVGFVGVSRYGPEHPQWIAFVRGNVALRLQAEDLRVADRPSLAAAARRMDAELAELPLLADGEALPRPVLTVFSAARTKLVAGEKVRLKVAANDPLDGEPSFGWILGGPGTGYVERGEDGAWYLHTTGPGSMEVVAEVLGSNGTFVRRSIRLEVLPD